MVRPRDPELGAVRHALVHPNTGITGPAVRAALTKLFNGTSINFRRYDHKKTFYTCIARMLVEIDEALFVQLTDRWTELAMLESPRSAIDGPRSAAPKLTTRESLTMHKPPYDDLQEIRGWLAAQNDLLITLVAWVPNKEALISELLRKRELGTTKLLNSPVSDGLRAAYEAATQSLVAELQRFVPTGVSKDSQSPASPKSSGQPKDPA